MRFKKVLAAVLTPFMMLLNCPVMAAAASDAPAVKPSTEIVHKPVASVEAGKRIELYTEVSDESGVDVVRVYFKSKDAADYSFIALKQIDNQEKGLFEKFKSLGSDFKGQGFSGVLPAPANGSKSFEYLVLVKNKANTVVKSQTYAVAVTDDKDGGVAGNEPIQVYSELSQAPSEISGFTDNISIDIVESGGKLGAVAGLYSGLMSAGGGAVSGGTVAASSGGFTTTAAVVGSATAVVAVAGVAAIAGGGGGSGSSSSSGGQVTGSYRYTQTGNSSINGGSTDQGSLSLSGSFTQSGFTISKSTGSWVGTYTSPDRANVSVTQTVTCNSGSASQHSETHSASTNAIISGQTIDVAEYEIVWCDPAAKFREKWTFTR